MKKISVFSATLLSFLLSSAPVLAEEIKLSISKPTNVKIVDFSVLLGAIVGLILLVSVVIAFIFLIWGGVQWIISGGDKTGVEAAQHRIQAALLGLFIVFVAWAIFSIVGKFLGFDINNLTFQTPW